MMVAALDLLETGAAKRVGILDAEDHIAGGTSEIIRALGVDAERVVYYAWENTTRTLGSVDIKPTRSRPRRGR